MKTEGFACGLALALAIAAGVYAPSVHTQGRPRTTATPQKVDEEYTARIKKATPDARIFPTFNLTQGINIEQGEGLNVRGSVLKSLLRDKTSRCSTATTTAQQR